MVNRLEKRENESIIDYHKRIVCGKLVDKTLSDIDYTELSTYAYGKSYSSDVARRMFYGSKATIDILESSKTISNTTSSKKNEVEKMKPNYKSETAINKDGSIYSDKLVAMSEKDAKDANFMLDVHGFDKTKWELVNCKNSIWNAYAKKEGVQTLYSSKITVKPRTTLSLFDIEQFYSEMMTRYTPYKREKVAKSHNPLMVELPIFDLHFGKFSLPDVVGNDCYDGEKASTVFNYIIDTTIERIKDLKVEKIIFPVGNDFFHFDNIHTSTSAGTPQDTDMSPQTMFRDGVMLLIDGITRLSEIAPVEVFNVVGNHDMMSSYHAIMALYCYFYNDENVSVDIDASPRHYVEYGNCLIGFSHGDKEKKRISGIMQIEASESWGRTKYREFHLAHLHSEHVREENGVIIRNISSVTGTDTWHYLSGYVGAIRKCPIFIWNAFDGLDSIINITIS